MSGEENAKEKEKEEKEEKEDMSSCGEAKHGKEDTPRDGQGQRTRHGTGRGSEDTASYHDCLLAPAELLHKVRLFAPPHKADLDVSGRCRRHTRMPTPTYCSMRPPVVAGGVSSWMSRAVNTHPNTRTHKACVVKFKTPGEVRASKERSPQLPPAGRDDAA